MKFGALQETAVGNCLVRIRSLRVDLPGAAGWIWTGVRFREVVNDLELTVKGALQDPQGLLSAIAGLTPADERPPQSLSGTRPCAAKLCFLRNHNLAIPAKLCFPPHTVRDLNSNGGPTRTRTSNQRIMSPLL